MRYRGFNITYTTDKGVERENPATHRKDIRNGYYLQRTAARETQA